jgi:hypothetical protein
MDPMNPHAQWRLALAETISRRIAVFEGVEAIVVGGSVARGYADEYSDLEIPVFWETLPGDAVRQAVIADLGADLLYPYRGPALEDNLLIRGFQVDLWHNTVADEDKVIDAVLTGYSTDLGDSNFMDTLRSCIPLYGHAIIAGWKARAQIYPGPLAIRTIEAVLTALDVRQLALHARRDNPTLLYGSFCELQQQLFLVLLALNRAYFPTFKWLYRTLETLPIQPTATAQRLRLIFRAPPGIAIDQMLRLIHETLELVERYEPTLPTAATRHKLTQARPAQYLPVQL